MGWFRKRSGFGGLEARLRSERPAPRPDFVRAVVDRVESRRPRAAGLRIAVALALTMAMLVAVASFGGVSYAAAGAQEAVKTVGKVLSPAKASRVADDDDDDGGGDDDDDDDGDDDPDDDQYVKACLDAVKQKTKTEQVLHKANMRAANNAQPKSARKALKKAEENRHKAVMRALAAEKRACGGRGDDDDDD